MENVEIWIKIAREAAASASAVILEVYGQGEFHTVSKVDNSPLTEADQQSHRIISDRLAATGLPVLSEEGASIPYATRKNWSWYWLVDPLDGTKEFVSRNGDFTVNIALMHNHVPVAGVIQVPVSGAGYWGGTALHGAWMETEEGGVVELKRTVPMDLEQPGIRVVASRSHMDEQTASFLNARSEPVLISRGSSLKFMILAEGKADIYPRFAPTMEWDTAAAHAILLPLGFSLNSVETGLSLVYNKENLRNPGFLCRSV